MQGLLAKLRQDISKASFFATILNVDHGCLFVRLNAILPKRDDDRRRRVALCGHVGPDN